MMPVFALTEAAGPAEDGRGGGIEANPVAQTATVVYDPAKTSLPELRRWVQNCGPWCSDPLDLSPPPQQATA
jgi:hypothetical protein